MPEMTPLGNTFNPPNPMTGINTLSGIIGLKQQQQALQTGQYQQATARAESEQAQQKNAELQKVGALMQQVHGGGYRKSDGSFDRQRFADDVTTMAPVYGQAVASSALSQANEIVQNQKAKQELTDSARASLGTTLTALAKDPNTKRDDVVSAYTQWLQDHKDDPAAFRVGVAQAAMLPQNDADPKYRETLGKYAATLTGQPTNAPSTVDTGGSIQPGQTSAVTGAFTPAGAGIPKTLAPGATPMTDAFGRPFLVNPQTATARPVGGSGFQQPVADQPAIMAELREARAATSQAGVTRNVNQHLLDLSSETKTGPGTQTLQGIAAAIGLPSGSRYQEISAYLDRQAALQAQVMGVPNTNAGLAAAERATGTTEYTPQALREKVKFFDALNSGAMAYRQGLDKAVGTGATPDLTKYQAFRSAWTKNFDPDVYRAEDAMRRGDKEELTSIRKRVGAVGMKALAVKSANLRALENGEIPGG